MAKHRLKLYDFDQDYLLIGIHSNSEIYKLAYEINSVLKISLKREKDLEFSNINSVYPLYKYSSLKAAIVPLSLSFNTHSLYVT